ncbi:MAG: TrkH family potassium uptake protein, partial [Firmicutes bacterium]|nr:TrkH family potassium uptake protein [Bacillota bacterium]
NKLNFKKYRLQTKLILTTTAVLLTVPFIYFFFFEFGAHPLKERILLSAFQTVTPRTAGFNTADFSQISGGGIMVTIILMLIGGATGSTAGGIKVTTISVLAVSAFSVFVRRRDASAFNRRIAVEIIYSAAAVFFIYLILFVFSALIISKADGLPIGSCLFESASAIATVGLTLGITAKLGLLSRLIIMFLMFFGRVGGLTLIFAAVAKPDVTNVKLPLEPVGVG